MNDLVLVEVINGFGDVVEKREGAPLTQPPLLQRPTYPGTRATRTLTRDKYCIEPEFCHGGTDVIFLNVNEFLRVLQKIKFDK